MAEAEIEIHDRKGRRLDTFRAAVDPLNAEECVALLRTRARVLRRPVEELRLVTWTAGRRRRLEYRT